MTKLVLSNGHIQYSKHGTADEILIAFHGFGQDKNIFKKWGDILGEKYTLYALDIFYHGESRREYSKLSKKEWSLIFEQFLKKEGIQQFSILGFSLGGRFAIASALSFPNRISELFLIAPDGVFLTIWFKLATHWSIRWLFKYYMMNPDKLDRLIRFNERFKIVSPYLGDFVRKELGNAENTKRVYVSWNHFKTLGYSKKQLSKSFKKHSFNRIIILGSKDQIIKPVKIIPIIETMGDFRIELLPMKHHQLIKPEVAKLILNSDHIP
ncbi:alpha/beta fold hydrolase [Ekhidna sp.]|uniref:alpha/beta fold hydrolase n=1 Tax=Ekhidna sp. TaxID=2608089 RepID=UPI003B50BA88